MVNSESHSASELLCALVDGPVVNGTVFGRHELRFGDYVLAFTSPGTARMPNGIECRVTVRPGARVSTGGGRLVVGRDVIAPGPAWDPVPAFERFPCLPPGLEPSAGTRPMGADGTQAASAAVLGGYVSGLVLLHGQRARAERIASLATPLLGPSAATLLRHAARGEVPQPVHALLSTRETVPLISWWPLGIAWLRGLVSAGLPLDPAGARVAPRRRTA